MSLLCPDCGYVHTSSDAEAVGRFSASGPDGYRSTIMPSAPLRATREEAVRDTCRIRCSPQGVLL